MTEVIITVLIFLAVYYSVFLNKIFKGLKTPNKVQSWRDEGRYVSVIIPFRNESENILKNLESIEAQNFPKDKFEVLYINDLSQDDSAEKIRKSEKSFNVKLYNVPEVYADKAHKKRAIQFGIEHSKGDIIVTTDADCTMGPKWLSVLISMLDEKTGFVAGAVRFLDNGTIFGSLQRLEFGGLVLAGGGLIGAGNPVICNAANIAYSKTAFSQISGFENLMYLSSGDDELLMQKIHSETDLKIKFCIDERAIVNTNSNRSFHNFFQQRKRWASKGLFYPDKKIVLNLSLIYIYYLSIPVQIICFITKDHLFLYVLIITLILKLFGEYKILNMGLGILFSKRDLKLFLLAEFLQIPYIIIAGISGLFGNYSWKGRKVKR